MWNSRALRSKHQMKEGGEAKGAGQSDGEAKCAGQSGGEADHKDYGSKTESRHTHTH